MLIPDPLPVVCRYHCLVKSQKNNGTIILMISSIVLLLILQLLWLRSSYNEELESFKKETNTLFRTTIIGMHDSLIMKGIEPVFDSVEIKRSADKSQVRIWSTKIASDSVLSRIPPEKVSSIQVRDSSIQIFIATDRPGDSIKQVLRPIVSGVRRMRESRNFVFRFDRDSLRIDDIQRNYQDTLKTIGITIAPVVGKIEMRKIDSGKTETE